MRRLVLLALGFALLGCASDNKQLLTPGTRVIYFGKYAIFTYCDRGNRIYQTETGLLQVVPNGCADGQP